MDQVAENPLLDAYFAKRADLLRFFTLRMGSAADAEDLVQDIYLKVSTAIAGAEVQSPAAYLYRLGSNLLIDRMRKSQRTARRDGDWRAVSHATVGNEDIADAPPPEEAIDARRRVEAMTVIVESLPPQCRRVFQMHKIDGLTHVEVAQVLGISRSAVEKHVSLALRRLAEGLKR